ncbi:MAG: MFS transporter [Pyrinomonadaceae bacterium]
MPETSVKANSWQSKHVSYVVLIHLAFALIGTATTLLGVILPALAARFELDDSQSGKLFSAQFAGALLGTFLAERLWIRFGFSLTIVIGLFVMSAGVFGMGFFNLNGVVGGIFLNGIGIGLAIPSTNLLISALNPQKAASALNILNFVWSGGAMICPALVGFLSNSFDIRLPLTALAISIMFLGFIFAAFARFQNVPGKTATNSVFSDSPNVWRTGFALIIAALLFLCVGAENSLSGWLTAYSLRLQESQGSLWTITATVFWTAFLLGRLCAPLFLRTISANRFISICLLIGSIGAGLLLIPSAYSFLSIGTALAGFGLAPIFPTLFAQFTTRFGETGATKWLFVSGTLGGAFLTWLVGFLSTINGSLRSGLAATFVCFLIMFVLQTRLVSQPLADPSL